MKLDYRYHKKKIENPAVAEYMAAFEDEFRGQFHKPEHERVIYYALIGVGEFNPDALKNIRMVVSTSPNEENPEEKDHTYSFLSKTRDGTTSIATSMFCHITFQKEMDYQDRPKEIDPNLHEPTQGFMSYMGTKNMVFNQGLNGGLVLPVHAAQDLFGRGYIKLVHGVMNVRKEGEEFGDEFYFLRMHDPLIKITVTLSMNAKVFVDDAVWLATTAPKKP